METYYGEEAQALVSQLQSQANGPGDDERRGVINKPSEHLKTTNPGKAFWVGLSWEILDGLGFNAIDDAIYSDKKLNLSQRILLAVTILQALDLPVGKRGKGPKTELYEVGLASDLRARSVKGDGLDIHHGPQAHAAGQAIPEYNSKDGPSIALTEAEHRAIPVVKGRFNGTARSQLAKDIYDLRNFTNVPNSPLIELINLNRKMYPQVFKKK